MGEGGGGGGGRNANVLRRIIRASGLASEAHACSTLHVALPILASARDSILSYYSYALADLWRYAARTDIMLLMCWLSMSVKVETFWALT